MTRIRMPRAVGFLIRVLRDFFLHNHGMLLTGSVAFNLMLSLIPLCVVLVVAVSVFIRPEILMDTLVKELEIIAPAYAPAVMDAIGGFIRNRGWAGWIGLISLLFFSSKAFRVLEDAFAVIFQRPLPSLRRNFWVSVLLPYFFILIVAAGLILVTAVNALLDAGGEWLAGVWPEFGSVIGRHGTKVIYLTNIGGLVLLFALLYKIIPVARISFPRALAGGFTATALWEAVRHLLIGYYAHVSSFNMIYGSMATIVIVLLTLEAAALILLLGAQVIAELQRNANLGIPWHAAPPEDAGSVPEREFPRI